MIYTKLNATELKQALTDAEEGKAPAIRDYIMDKIMSYKTFLSNEELLALNRSASAGNLQ